MSSTPAYTIEYYDNRGDWLRARKRGIGASEAAAVLGFSRFKSAYSIAVDKLTEAVDETMDETAEWGTRHEPAIAQKLSEVLGYSFYDPGDFTIYRSTERKHIFCTPDRLRATVVGDEIEEVEELKCAWYEAAKEWNERVPLAYQMQGQQCMYVLGCQRMNFGALLNGCSFRHHPMKRHQAFIDRMLEKLDAFWASIQKGEMPNCDGSMATAQALARMYPKPGEGIVEMPEELESLGAEYDAILAQDRENEKRKLAIQNIVKEHIGPNKTAVLMDRSGFSWNGTAKGSRTFRRVARVGDLNE